jgi:ribonucleoside-diphosphate reductase alpha chain
LPTLSELSRVVTFQSGLVAGENMHTIEAKLPPPEVQMNGAASHETQLKKGPVRPPAVRCRLPDERRSTTHRFSVAGHKGYLTVGMYPNGEPGELFIVMAKEGSTVSGLVSSFAQVVSVALQYGVPLEVLCEKFVHTRFEPSGFTGNPEVPMATSIMDYIFQWLRLRFLGKPVLPASTQHALSPSLTTIPVDPLVQEAAESSDAPLCCHCGSLTKRNGSCFSCVNCGESTGCG